MTFNFLCTPQLPTEKYVATDDTFECDYDQNPTSLYEALEEHAWHPALQFLETGVWEKGLFLMEVPDPLPPQRQARTWVTRMDHGVVRWSQLPIHAALIFGAPYQVVQKIVQLYPQGVRCTDDQHMLPLHLAMKFGASDSIVACLLQLFPESLFTRDVKGRLPTELVTTPRNQIMESIINVMQKSLTKKHQDTLQKSTAEMRDDLQLQNKLNAELEREKTELETNYRKAQAEVNLLQLKVEEYQRLLQKQQKQHHQLQLQQQQQQQQQQLQILQQNEQPEYTRRSTRSNSRTRRSKTESRDYSGDSTVSVGGGISIHGDSRYRPLGHVESVVHRRERRKTKQDPYESIATSSIGVDSKIFRTANFFKGFGTTVKE